MEDEFECGGDDGGGGTDFVATAVAVRKYERLASRNVDMAGRPGMMGFKHRLSL